MENSIVWIFEKISRIFKKILYVTFTFEKNDIKKSFRDSFKTKVEKN